METRFAKMFLSYFYLIQSPFSCLFVKNKLSLMKVKCTPVFTLIAMISINFVLGMVF